MLSCKFVKAFCLIYSCIGLRVLVRSNRMGSAENMIQTLQKIKDAVVSIAKK